MKYIIFTKRQRDKVAGLYKTGIGLNPVFVEDGLYYLPARILINQVFSKAHRFLRSLPLIGSGRAYDKIIALSSESRTQRHTRAQARTDSDANVSRMITREL